MSALACDTAHRAGQKAEGTLAWTSLGGALRGVGRFEEAIKALTTARTLFQEASDRHSEAIAWHTLGTILAGAGQAEEAIRAIEHAVEVYEVTGDTHRLTAVQDDLKYLRQAHAGAGRTSAEPPTRWAFLRLRRGWR
ncbi:hypothetical protein GCM10027294_52750 [Marinactinospora endophytica]